MWTSTWGCGMTFQCIPKAVAARHHCGKPPWPWIVARLGVLFVDHLAGNQEHEWDILETLELYCPPGWVCVHEDRVHPNSNSHQHLISRTESIQVTTWRIPLEFSKWVFSRRDSRFLIGMSSAPYWTVLPCKVFDKPHLSTCSSVVIFRLSISGPNLFQLQCLAKLWFEINGIGIEISHVCDDSGTAAFIRAVAQRKVTASRMGLVWPPSSSVPGTPKTRQRPVRRRKDVCLRKDFDVGMCFTAKVVADCVFYYQICAYNSCYMNWFPGFCPSTVSPAHKFSSR